MDRGDGHHGASQDHDPLRQRAHGAYSDLFEAKRREREQMMPAPAPTTRRVAALVPKAVVQHNRGRRTIDWLHPYTRTTASLRLRLTY